MKINPINVYTFNTPQIQTFTNQNSSNKTCHHGFDYSLNEAIGRSQVNFEGSQNRDEKYQEYDRMFVDTVAQNLRLSDEGKQKLTNSINTFLTANNYKSLEAIVGDKNKKIQNDFLFDLSDDICQSDFDYEILSDAFQDRMYYDEQYNPEVDLYEKDHEVIDHILDRYDMDEVEKGDLFDLIKMHADCLGGETVFDLFKPENKPFVLMDLIQTQLQLDEDLATNLLIDFGRMAKKDNETRFKDIYRWKSTDLMNQKATDHAIACEIIGEYDEFFNNDYIEDEEEDDDIPKNTINEIVEHVSRRRNGVSIEQIAFELAEKYNLPPEAYKFIKENILEYDGINPDND